MFSPWHYRAYDLHWKCDFELPELPVWPDEPLDQTADESLGEPLGEPLDQTPDLEITLSRALPSTELERVAATGQALEFGARRSRVLFQVARFTVSDGNHIEVEPVEGYDPAAWRVPLLGSVLAVLLEQRGLFVLHAGALAFESGAAAFLGEKGQGKSTLNAALSRAGFPLLSDDVVALQMPGRPPRAPHSLAPVASEEPRAEPLSQPLALCGFSQIKLSPDALRAVTGESEAAWPGVAPGLAGMNKLSFRAPLAARAQTLRALFVLSSSEAGEGAGEVRVRRLSVQPALAQLIPHTFGARFGQSYLQGARRKTHFLDCARLVNGCAVWELSRPRDLALLPATIERITRAMAELDR